MEQTPSHFSEIIQNEYSSRLKRNSDYSIRAFARDLDISPASLSLMLNKKAGLSAAQAEMISTKLKLNDDEKEFFKTLVQANCARSKTEQKIAKAKLCRYETRYNSVSVDIFQVIKDWYHLAIMELTLVKEFRANAYWIAAKLQITEEEAEAGLDRLIRLEILERVDGKLRPSNDYLVVLSTAPSEAAKHFQTQILKKLTDSFTEHDRSTRDIASVVLRMKKSEIDYVKNALKEARRDIAAHIQEGDDHDSVYCLTTSLFRLDRDL